MDHRRVLAEDDREPETHRTRWMDRLRYHATIICTLAALASILSIVVSTAAAVLYWDFVWAWASNVLIALVTIAAAALVQWRLQSNWWWYDGE